MITEKQVTEIVNRNLEGTALFPVEVSVRSGNRIFVFIDGDSGVTIDDCRDLNRFIESELSRDQEDYDLTVSTAGADQPLRFPRQYPKHVGRTFEITLGDDNKIAGKLISAGNEEIVIEPVKGKKEIQKENTTIPYNQIKEAKIKLAFK